MGMESKRLKAGRFKPFAVKLFISLLALGLELSTFSSMITHNGMIHPVAFSTQVSLVMRV